MYTRGAPDTLYIAIAGNIGYGLQASQEIRDAVEQLQAPTVDVIRLAVLQAINRIYEEQIFHLWRANGRTENDDFEMIIGIEDSSRRFTVLATSGNSVHEVTHYEFGGAGAQLAHYVAERLFGSMPTSTAVTEELVRQVFREIKSKGIFVGGNTEIRSRRASANAEQFLSLKLSGDQYRFLWGLDDALLSAVRVALDHKGHRPLPGHRLPKRLEDRLKFIRQTLTRLYAESSAERTNPGTEHQLTEFGTEYGDPLKDFY
jgi:hypothetical protein